jgi:enoyl-CoA hydratase
VIRTTDRGTYREVTIDRPERANALTPAALDDLAAAVAEASEPVVYLRGAGDRFCAGADLDVVADLEDPAAFAERGQRTADAIATADAVVVAGIDGAARGGGVELALACDLRVATPDATFAESGVEHGLFGAWGGTVRLPEVVGLGEAMDLALSGRTVDAATAREMGLVSRVVEDPRSVAASIADNDPAALRVIKERRRDGAPRQQRLQREAAAFADLLADRQADIAANRN